MAAFLLQLFTLFESYILRPLVWLWPIKWAVVPPGSAAVRFTWGHPGPDLAAGVHFATSCQTLTAQHVARHALATGSVKALTRDGVPVSVDAVITYRVYSLARYATQAATPEDYLAAIGEAAVLATIQSNPLEALYVALPDLHREMVEAIQPEATDLGVTVRGARLQTIEHLDPFVRAMVSTRVAAPALAESARELQEATDADMATALASLAPSISYVRSVGPEATPAEVVTLDES